MPDLSAQGSTSEQNQGFYDYTKIGTAVGTAVIATGPTLLHSVFFPNRVAAGSITIYDSNGTSSNLIGTIVLGTQPGYDPVLYTLDYRTKNGLTIVNSGNLGAIVANI